MRLKDVEPLRRLGLLEGVDEALLDRLSRGAYLQRFPRGVVLFERGEVADFLHVLLEGAVELVARTETAREAVVEILWPVDCFIPAAALTGTPYLMSARTLEPSQVLMLEASNLRACVAADVALANAMVRLLAGQFRRAVRQIKDLKLRTGTQRLGAFLLRLVDETGVDGVARLPFSKATLASRLGMTPENLSRALRTLEAHGLAMEGSRVSLPDRAALEELVQIDHLIDRGDDEPPPLAA